MEKLTIKTSSNSDLEFNGELVAEASSRRGHDQPRWSELRVYRTDTGKWIFEIIGKSAIPGEIERINALVANDSKGLVNLFYKPDEEGGYYLSVPAKIVLRALAEKYPDDPEFKIIEKI